MKKKVLEFILNITFSRGLEDIHIRKEKKIRTQKSVILTLKLRWLPFCHCVALVITSNFYTRGGATLVPGRCGDSFQRRCSPMASSAEAVAGDLHFTPVPSPGTPGSPISSPASGSWPRPPSPPSRPSAIEAAPPLGPESLRSGARAPARPWHSF